VALIAWGSLAGWQPFSAVDQLRASIKDGKFVVRTQPPALDADRLSVADVCTEIHLTPREALANARAQGIAIGDTTKTLGAIAIEAGVSPEVVFQALQGEREVRP